MKLLLFGSTGFIGKEVLNQSLKNPAITSLIAFSRRNLPEADTNPKLSVIVIEDFKVYPDHALEHIKSADACIWSIGTYKGDPVVELEYPEEFQKALLKVMDENKTFRYVYLGGAFTEEDQKKSLWFFTQGRRVRGLAQTQFLDFGKKNRCVETYVVRPAGVVWKDRSVLLDCLLWPFPTVGIDELAVIMVDLALNGGNDQIVVNKVIIEKGKELLTQ